MAHTKKPKAKINQAKGQSLFKFISTNLESKTIEHKMNALATIVQTLALGGNDIATYTKNFGPHITGSKFNEIAGKLDSDEDVKYMPKNITSDVYIFSHIKQHFDDGLKPEDLFNTIQHWMMAAREDMTGVYNFAVLIDDDKFGTAQHKDSTRIAAFINYGPVRVMVIENKNKSTSLVLTLNEQYEDCEEEQAVA
jgi:hypothetical protein